VHLSLPLVFASFMRAKAQTLYEMECIARARQSLRGVATTVTQMLGTA